MNRMSLQSFARKEIFKRGYYRARRLLYTDSIRDVLKKQYIELNNENWSFEMENKNYSFSLDSLKIPCSFHMLSNCTVEFDDDYEPTDFRYISKRLEYMKLTLLKFRHNRSTRTLRTIEISRMNNGRKRYR